MPTCRELLHQLRQKRLLNIGDPVLDKFFGGSLPTGVIELVSEAGCGKTQLALQLWLRTHLPEELGGVDGDAIYISTEGHVPLARLEQMIDLFGVQDNEHIQSSLKSRIISVSKSDELLDVLGKLESLDPKTGRPLRLLVIDSVAGLFRIGNFHFERESAGDLAEDSELKRADLLQSVGAQLQRISAWAEPCHCLCLNQVSDAIDIEHFPTMLYSSVVEYRDHPPDKSVKHLRHTGQIDDIWRVKLDDKHLCVVF